MEWARDLTPTPLFSVNRFREEVIIDMPFCRIIMTPAKRIDRNRRYKNDEQKHQDHSRSSAYIAED